MYSGMPATSASPEGEEEDSSFTVVPPVLPEVQLGGYRSSADVDWSAVTPSAASSEDSESEPPQPPPGALLFAEGTDGSGRLLPNDGDADAGRRRRRRLVRRGIFPPTVFTDAAYVRGILVRGCLHGTCEAAAASEKRMVRIDLGGDYFAPEPEDELRWRNAEVGADYRYGGWSGTANSDDDAEDDVDCDTDSSGEWRMRRLRVLPALSRREDRLWRHSLAASAAASRRFPLTAVRLLGTITLLFEERIEPHPAEASSLGAADGLDEIGLVARIRKYRQQSRRRAGARRTAQEGMSRLPPFRLTMKQSLRDVTVWAQEDGDGSVLPDEEELERRAQELRRTWKEDIWECPPDLECWDTVHGGFAGLMLGDLSDGHVPLPVLLEWLAGGGVGGGARVMASELEGEEEEEGSRGCKKRRRKNPRTMTTVSVTDLQGSRMAELCGGLRRVETDGKSALEALLELSAPSEELYGTPLITPYAVAEAGAEDGDGSGSRSSGGIGPVADPSKRTWTVRIGVYCSRLLPEVLTSRSLHVVMSSLDVGSYRVSEPLRLPPQVGPDRRAFVSAPFPEVNMEEAREDEDIEIEELEGGGDGDEDRAMAGKEEEEEGEGEGSYRGGDAALRESTRDGKRISPFTARGLLKLLESGGNDVSMWPEIEKVISPVLRLDLMLHQKHAICWMAQMESLGGFGINSILWEEREFLDGGSFYYSPALGQLRLTRPPEMKGGLLCDEMGLGKTLEVLGLIIYTLDELKVEARARGPNSVHATLIIVPPALAMQWSNEIRKAVGESLAVDFLDARTAEIRRLFGPNVSSAADVVITTYGALDKPKPSRLLSSVGWGRIVLDEMQEIRSSTTKIARTCERLRCRRRWMLSGTPLFEGISDLRGELNFLRLEPFAAGLEDGFFDFAVAVPWKMRKRRALELLGVLRLLMLRRSKDMTIAATGLPLLGLKRLSVEFVSVAQERSERALYCWMEHFIAEHLRRDGNASEMKSRNLCLRLLRWLCMSPVLLNGGLGVSSQLMAVNRLMIESNRRRESTLGGLEPKTEQVSANDTCVRVVSCEGALRLLTQAERAQTTREDFVSTETYGMSHGGTHRNRAIVSVEERYHAAEKEVGKARKELLAAARKRAKAHWHTALELITTGALWPSRAELRVSRKFAVLWTLRLICSRIQTRRRKKMHLPTVLTRGWRPSAAFLRRDLFASHPEWAWIHPLALQVENIPEEVTLEDLSETVFEASKRTPQAVRFRDSVTSKLHKKQSSVRDEQLTRELSEAEKNVEHATVHDSMMKRVGVVRCGGGSSTWSATLHFHDEEDLQFILKKASASNGFSLQSSNPIPSLEKAIEETEAIVRQAKSEQKVYPCPMNQKKLCDARKAHEIALLGLRVVSGKQAKKDRMVAVLSRSVEPFRTLQPRTAGALIGCLGNSVFVAAQEISRTNAVIAQGQEKMARLKPALDCPSNELRELSAFETLEALVHNELDKTQCPICIFPFGSALTKAQSKRGPVVAMVNCGHFFCIECIQRYCREMMASGRGSKCPSCRKPFFMSRDVVHVDHLQTEEKEAHEQRVVAAKKKVLEASSQLDESNGQLDGSMWHALFLSFDLPPGVSTRAHETLWAIPRDVLAHLRAATEMEVHRKSSEVPSSESSANAGRSSKVVALLRDLPLDERSVVFTGTKEGVLHLRAVMNVEGIGCRALFVGQDSKTSERAVAEWEEDGLVGHDVKPPTPVLIVQAGAAASGLTLVKACKMFLLEPFARQEEEQQAFARCHRYGQKKDVEVKCYFSPVTVESRLLEWRSRGAAQNTASASFSADADEGEGDVAENEPTSSVEESEQGERSEDMRRSMFLLGLMDENGNPICNVMET